MKRRNRHVHVNLLIVILIIIHYSPEFRWMPRLVSCMLRSRPSAGKAATNPPLRPEVVKVCGVGNLWRAKHASPGRRGVGSCQRGEFQPIGKIA